MRKLLLTVLGLALLVIWAAAASANFAHGMIFAGASAYAPVFGMLSVAGDVVKAATFLGGTAAWLRKRYLAAICCGLVWFPATIWSVWSCMSFAATIQSDTISTRSMHEVADQSLLRQVSAQEKRVQDLQDLKLRAPTKDWDRYEKEVELAEKRLDGLRQRVRVTEAVGSSYALGDALKQLGIDPAAVKLAQILTFLLLVELGSNLGLYAFAPLLGIKMEAVAEEAEKQMVPEIPAAPETPAKKTPVAGSPTKPAKVKPLKKPFQEHAAALLAHLEARYGEGSTIASGKVWEGQVDMCREAGWGLLSTRQLVKYLLDLGVQKEEDTAGKTLYTLPTAAEKRALAKGPQAKGPRHKM